MSIAAQCSAPTKLTSNVEQEFGGADRDRTGDPLVANQGLSQLSYSPVEVVGLGRVELPTSPLSGVRSSHLSYRPGHTRGPGAQNPKEAASFQPLASDQGISIGQELVAGR